MENYSNEAAAGMAAGVGIFGMLFYFLIIAVVIAGMWKVFVKAGKPGWAAIVPIYNIIVLLEIIGKPLWWIVLYFVPCANIVVAILVAIELAKRFGKDTVYGILIFILPMVMFPVLGFSDAKYSPPPAPAPQA